jgi:hypothetical protein
MGISGDHDAAEEASAGGDRGRCLVRLAGPGERQAGDDGVGKRGPGLGETLAGGLCHRANALLQVDTHVGGTGHALAQDRTGAISKARAASCAAAVNAKKK